MARRFKVYLFDVFYSSKFRAGYQLVLECFDALRLSLCKGFDAPVRKVTNISQNLMAGGGALREKTVADTLHLSAN